jgi:exopolysaccharide biosynthesis polyprenyl glycosylphosphotransferase
MRSNVFLVPTLVAMGDWLALALAWFAARAVGEVFSPLVLIPLVILHQLVLSTGTLHTQLRYVGLRDLLRRVLSAWWRIAAAVCIACCLVPEQLPREAAIVFCAAFLLTLTSVRVGSMLLRRFVRQRGRNLRYVVIAGGGPAALRARHHCLSDPGLGLRVVGHLVRADAAGNERAVMLSGDVLGDFDDLGRLVREHVIDEVVFADPQCSFAAMLELIETARAIGLRTHVLTEFLAAWRGVDVQQWQGDVVLRLTPYPHDVFGLSVKRAVDIVGSSLLLVALLPLFTVIAIAIRLDSRGPMLFGLWRSGRNGRRFWFPKFRSMCDGAHARLAELAPRNEMGGPVFKMRNDPRVTRVGRFLRRWSLDELPQLWCVLIGDMSLVGPRPLMMHETACHEAWQRRRLSVRPGLTCLWQISGRNDIDFEEWMQMDLHYIDRWSLWLDLRILARTVPAVLTGRGAS